VGEAAPRGFVEVEDYATAAVEGFAAEFEQALEGVGTDGALLHGGLGVAGDGRVDGGCPHSSISQSTPSAIQGERTTTTSRGKEAPGIMAPSVRGRWLRG
jgi:hypothetical protein